ncbi:hypothetical protein AVEN_39664-1 [Araneus ventricosus]|uniref:Uncharacterized protein n=1 Tax=Araneus ventricosus TaxID=182803 RepID=A0A4Y2X1W1_ARAVE|nr:hypothetical protein AVEN_39664-1 [Araneus ventricosus]
MRLPTYSSKNASCQPSPVVTADSPVMADKLHSYKQPVNSLLRTQASCGEGLSCQQQTLLLYGCELPSYNGQTLNLISRQTLILLLAEIPSYACLLLAADRPLITENSPLMASRLPSAGRLSFL